MRHEEQLTASSIAALHHVSSWSLYDYRIRRAKGLPGRQATTSRAFERLGQPKELKDIESICDM